MLNIQKSHFYFPLNISFDSVLEVRESAGLAFSTLFKVLSSTQASFEFYVDKL